MTPNKLFQYAVVVALGATFICWVVGIPLNIWAILAFAFMCVVAFGADGL